MKRSAAPAATAARRPRKRRLAKTLGALAVCGSVAAATAPLTSGCQQSPTVVPVRSLQNSGKVSFVCLSPLEPSERPLAECTAQQFTSICQYEYQNDAGTADADVVRNDAGVPVATLLPHLYALVTQKTTGEVAVVDTSSLANSVLDENPLEPGASFLHIGAQPTGIASTPGSVATFVGVAEPGRAGLFAIPSSKIRPATSFGVPDTCSGNSDAGAVEPPQLSSWPACALPSAPGDILMVDDPVDAASGLQRATCDSKPSINPLAANPADGKDNTISAKERRTGRAKLVIAFPDLGGIGVFDAQTLLDRPPGSFDACTIERWVPLKVDVAGLAGQPALPTGSACSNPRQYTPALPPLCGPDAGPPGEIADAGPTCLRAQPGGISYADGKLYVADLGAPVIHVVDMHDASGNPTPCNPIEQAPLLPSSAEQPERVVYASKVAAASQLTPDFKRYLYATDVRDASAMIFDIGPSSTTRRPLTRAHPEWDPFHPRDRVKFAAPPADIIIVQRDAPNLDPVTGLAPAGVLCNPDPSALSCTSESHNCDPGVAYQTSSDYTTGAGPLKLRGEFAFAALTSGRVAVIDIADFDAPCRGPVISSTLAGCSSDGPVPTTPPGVAKTSAEISCGVVSRGEPRASNYEAVGTFGGNRVPGILTYPQLFQNDGSVFPSGSAVPQMVASLPAGGQKPDACQTCNPLPNCTTPCDNLPGCPLQTFIGGALTPLYTGGDAPGTFADCPIGGSPVAGSLTTYNALAMNLEDPRAHVADQGWTVAFEGVIPGFDQRVAYLSAPASGKATLTDPNSRFCDYGVLGEQAVTEQIAAKPAAMLTSVTLGAADYADYVQVTNALTDPSDPYWNGPSAACNAAATYGTCFAQFGSTDQQQLNIYRDLRILEAYQDRVEVEARNAFPDPTLPPVLDLLRCCFPSAINFVVRSGNQWSVVGDQSGFLHHVVADKDTGVCRNACDGTFQRRNGRVITSAPGSLITDRAEGEIDPSPSFMNPMFRFGIVLSSALPACKQASDCSTSGVCQKGSCQLARDTLFRFQTNNSFTPLLMALNTNPTILVEPTGITYVPATQELAVTDGSLSGLIMVSLSSAALSRSFF